MATVKDILEFVETLAPTYMKEDWDNVGLNCGRLDREVQKVLVALDPFAEVCQEAKETGAQVLLTHHALIWNPGFITDQTEAGKNTLFLVENGIASINAHTNLDCAPGGVNDTLAAVLGLQNVQVVKPVGEDAQGRPYGLLRMGTVEKQELGRFLQTVKERLGCPGLRYVDGGRPVCRVAVGGGSCGSALMDALNADCDTFVTADVKYNQFWDAKELGMNLMDAGHFYTENPVCRVLADKLRGTFPELLVEVSQKHKDPMKFFG